MENALTKDEVKQVFDTFDKDKNGQLELDELKSVIKQLGITMSDYNVKKIIKNLDIDKDGKVSFDEFYLWWLHGKKNGLEDVVFLQMKTQKALGKVRKAIGKLEAPGAHQNSDHHIAINVGQQAPKTNINARVLVGSQARDLQEELTKDLENITPQTPGVILQFKVKDYDSAQESFQDIVEQLLSLAESVLPPEIAEQITEGVKVSYAKGGDNILLIGVTGEHELLNNILQQYQSIIEDFQLDKETLTSISASISTNASLKEFVSKKEDVLTNQIADLGLNLSLDLHLNGPKLHSIRQMIYKHYAKLVQKDKLPKYGFKKDVQILLPLLQISGSRIELNFQNMNQFKEKYNVPFCEEIPPSFADLIKSIIANGDVNLEEMYSEIPTGEEIYQLFKEQVIADVSVFANLPEGLIQLTVQTEGIRQLADYVMEQSKEQQKQ